MRLRRRPASKGLSRKLQKAKGILAFCADRISWRRERKACAKIGARDRLLQTTAVRDP